MQRRDFDWFTKPQRIKFGGVEAAFFVFGFVDGKHNGLVGAAQEFRYLFIGGGQPFAPIHHEDNHIGFIHRHQRLFADMRREGVIVFGGKHKPAGINHIECAPNPLAFTIHTVARCAWHVLNNRFFLANQAIE